MSKHPLRIVLMTSTVCNYLFIVCWHDACPLQGWINCIQTFPNHSEKKWADAFGIFLAEETQRDDSRQAMVTHQSGNFVLSACI